MRKTAGWALLSIGLSITASALADEPIVVRRTWPDEWPMDPAPITSSVWPALPPPLPPEPPQTQAAARVVELLTEVRAAQIDSAYQHRTDVRAPMGRYR